MQISAERAVVILREVFPECNDIKISTDTLLGVLPELDAMAAVNLQTFLLQQFQVEVPLELLSDQTSLQEVAAFLENPVCSQAC